MARFGESFVVRQSSQLQNTKWWFVAEEKPTKFFTLKDIIYIMIYVCNFM